MIGPNYQKGTTKIGRNVLPAGYVAILDNAEALAGSIMELHAYAERPPTRKPPLAVVFRTLSEGERRHMCYRVYDLLGVEDYAAHCDLYVPKVGSWYVIDSEHLGHAWGRHGGLMDKDGHGQPPLTAEDSLSIPEVIRAGNITEFAVAHGMARVVYECAWARCRLKVVTEVRKKGRIYLKTVHRVPAK